MTTASSAKSPDVVPVQPRETATQLLAQILDVLQADRGLDMPADETDYRDYPIGTAASTIYADNDRQYQYVYIPNAPRDLTLWTGTRSQYLGSWAEGAQINFRMPRQTGLTIEYGAGSAAETLSVYFSARPIEINSVGSSSPGYGVAVEAADNMANPTAPWELAALMGWDGSTWDRLKVDTVAGGLLVTGAVGTTLGDGYAAVSVATYRTQAGTYIYGAVPMLYNGATLDRHRANVEGTALASAARTATTQSADIVNYNGRGILVTLNSAAASGTGGLQVRVQFKDPVAGTYNNINSAPGAVIATGVYSYAIYPGGITGGSIIQSTSQALPRTFRVEVTHGDASSYTYSVGYCLIN